MSTENDYVLKMDARQYQEILHALKTHPNINHDIVEYVGMLQAARPQYRYVLEPDPEPDLSYLQHTEEEYKNYQMFDDPCRHCGVEVEWVTDGRKRTPRHVGETDCKSPEMTPLSYEEYMAGHGDPENWYSFVVRTQRRCAGCGEWEDVSILAGLDLYYDEPLPPYGGGVYTKEQLEEHPWGEYVLEVAEW